MKLLFGMLFLCAQVMLGVCLYRTSGEKHKLTYTVKRLLLMGFIIVLFNIVALFTPNTAVALFAYSAYYIAADWILYYLFHFSIEYIGSRFEDYVNKKVMLALLCIDSVSIILNNFFGHLFSVDRVMVSEDRFFQPDITPFFFTHYGLIMMLIVFCLISLIYRAFKAPDFYRRKYMLIAVILIAIVITTILCMQSPVDATGVLIAAEGICIYYCAFVYTPQRLLPKTLFLVSQSMSLGLLVMDIDGKKIFANDYARKLTEGIKPLADKNGTGLEQWCRDKYTDGAEEFTVENAFYRDGTELILKIQLERLLDSNNQIQGGYFIIQDRTEEILNLKKERYLATHDSLTGLYNKEYFCERAVRYIRDNSDDELLMICTDIKDFKMINDFFGPGTGDNVLTSFAEILRQCLGSNVLYGRLGNDIFSILMKKKDFDEAGFIANAQKAFASCANESTAFPSINYIGVYEITEPDLPITVMCDRARMAITSIKGDYHKRIAYYGSELRNDILREQELISDLDTAISENQLKMYLQPQMSADGRLLGAEALVRWIHPVKGQLMPGEFIPVFEKNGLISDVDKYIWELACKQIRKWMDDGKDDLYISVNISPRDFYFLNIYQIFTELIEKYSIDPKYLKLEITETAVVMDFERQLDLISRLRKTGFVVEMDDFGSGYSSLNMLKDIHVDVLKIDMAFLKKAEDEERSKKILQMIISLSNQLGMPVITEGVETAEQIRFLSEMGCDMFQGYYFAKPMPVEQFEKLYESQRSAV